MANRTSANLKSKRSKPKSTLENIIIFPPIIAVIALVWLILMKLDQLPQSLTFNLDFESWLAFWMMILLILIVILACLPQIGRTQYREEVRMEKDTTKHRTHSSSSKTKSVTRTNIESEDKPVAFVPLTKEDSTSITETAKDELTPITEPELKAAEIVASPAPKEKTKPIIIEYPLDVEGGIYGDTFINLDSENILKLRTLVVNDIYLL